jgi:hypothetical protein
MAEQTYKRVGLRGRGEGSDWLGSYTWPHTKEVWTGKYTWLVSRISSLMGKVTHFCRGYQIVAVTPCSGKGTTNAAGKELHEVLVNL